MSPSLSPETITRLLDAAEAGVSRFLDAARQSGALDQNLCDEARRHTLPSLARWMRDPDIDRLSPRVKEGIAAAIEAGRWQDLVNAFHRSVRFGTGGIRTMMAFDRASIVRLKEDGIGAPILKGTNTINDIVLLVTSAGAARYGKSHTPPFQRIVIGYDSRIRGYDFAALVAQLFLAYDYTVYLFDEACPYPEVTFAIPDAAIRAELGVFISASHNDYRYNGYKLSCANGSQFDVKRRNDMYDHYIAKTEFSDIKLCPFDRAPKHKLFFLGGDRPRPGFDYAGREDQLINMHARHREHVKSFLMTPDLADRQAAADAPLSIAYCAFHGAGRTAVPRLLREVGFRDVRPVTRNGLNELDGLFPSFCSDPGREQQPDPGDPRAADIAMTAFRAEYPEASGGMDILIGTDPDADRCGLVVRVPAAQRHLHGGRDYCLLPADDMWALILWYRLQREIEQHGRVRDAERKFVTLSHTTSDSIARVARRFGVGVVRTWVGFPTLAAGTSEIWALSNLKGAARRRRLAAMKALVDGRTGPRDELCHPLLCGTEDLTADRAVNIAAAEQSNGFSILGAPPADDSSLGVGGHVRDKDGTFAALLVAEVAAWAKERGFTLIDLLDRHIYLDPAVGLFVGAYEPDPLDGEYPGIEGDRIKLAILRRTLAYFQLALAGDLEIGGRPVRAATVFRTGKYDAIYPPSYDFAFPDEGVRFFFDDARLSHVTVRPSGTGNSLRFYIQLHAPVTAGTLLAEKARLQADAARIMDDLRLLLRAPRT